MKVSKLEQYLYALYRAEGEIGERRTTLLLGQPGIGKSDTCRRVAQNLARDMGKEFVDYDDNSTADKILSDPDSYFVFVDFRLSEVEPSDLLGIPQQTDGAVRYSPLMWAKCLSKCAGMLLLDEITNIQRPDVMTAAYKLVYDRRAGFMQFSDDVYIIAAGNRPEESAVANMLPTPLVNRMFVIDVGAPWIDEWQDYMTRTYGDNWDSRVYAFLKRFQDEGYFLRPPSRNEVLEGFPTPRSWTHLSLLMKQGFEDIDAFVALLGGEVGEKFSAFLKTDVDIEDLIKTPSKFRGLGLDGKYMATVMLSSWIANRTVQTAKKCFKLIDEMTKESNEYLVVTCIGLNKDKLKEMLTALFDYDSRYSSMLSEIALKAKAQVERK